MSGLDNNMIREPYLGFSALHGQVHMYDDDGVKDIRRVLTVAEAENLIVQCQRAIEDAKQQARPHD